MPASAGSPDWVAPCPRRTTRPPAADSPSPEQSDARAAARACRWRPTDEATAVVRKISALITGEGDRSPRYRPGDIAIVLRSVRRHRRQFEEALRAAGIPHEVGASPNVASSEIVRFAIHSMNALARPDDDTYLMRVLDLRSLASPRPTRTGSWQKQNDASALRPSASTPAHSSPFQRTVRSAVTPRQIGGHKPPRLRRRPPPTRDCVRRRSPHRRRRVSSPLMISAT
jgi:hypothetical protein